MVGVEVLAKVEVFERKEGEWSGESVEGTGEGGRRKRTVFFLSSVSLIVAGSIAS